MRRSILALTAAVLLVLAGCGSDGSDGSATTSTTGAASGSTTTSTPAAETTTSSADGTSTTTAEPTSTTTGSTDGAAACVPYREVLDLYGSRQPIATGSNEAQVAADAQWADAITQLQDLDAGSDPQLGGALELLATLSFQVTDDPTGAPTEQELLDAFATLDMAYGTDCGGQVTECPDPATLEAEGYTCDSEGNLRPIG